MGSIDRRIFIQKMDWRVRQASKIRVGWEMGGKML